MIHKIFILLKGHCLLPYWTFALFLFLLCSNVLATDIRRAEIILQDNSYILSADIDYQLSEKAREALQNGVPLFWILHVKVTQQRHNLWDKILAELTMRYRIQYHALLNMYRVKNEYSGAVDNFSTLSAALDWMSTIRNVQQFRALCRAVNLRSIRGQGRRGPPGQSPACKPRHGCFVCSCAKN